MTSPLENYLETRRDFERIRDAISKFAGMLTAVANELRSDPADFSFTNTGQGLPTIPKKNLNGDDWKSAKQIMELLSEYHTARQAVRTAWSNVPSDLRGGLQPLPSGAEPASARRYGR
jgi:hypothetical protein